MDSDFLWKSGVLHIKRSTTISLPAMAAEASGELAAARRAAQYVGLK
jgi:hypothetical protein